MTTASRQPKAANLFSRMIDRLRSYRAERPYAHCPLPELYRATAAGLTIGQFQDGVRELVDAGRVRLHPFTGAMYQLRDEQFAMVAGQEIKYYVELL